MCEERQLLARGDTLVRPRGAKRARGFQIQHPNKEQSPFPMRTLEAEPSDVALLG